MRDHSALSRAAGCLNTQPRCFILTAMERPKLMPHEWFGRRALFATTAAAALAGLPRAARSDATSVEVGYLRWLEPRPTISLLDKPPPDDGLAGAKLAMSDNNTTGRFMNQQFELGRCAGPCRRRSRGHSDRTD